MNSMDRERENFVHILEIGPDFRDRLEAAVDRLLDLLDAIDAPDEDIEEDDFGGGDANDEGEADDADDEPSLGAPEALIGTLFQAGDSQVCWARGGDQDFEDEHDGREMEEAI